MFAGVVVSSMPGPSATEHPLRGAAILRWTLMVHLPNPLPGEVSPSLWMCMDQLILGCVAVTNNPHIYSFISHFHSMLVEDWLQFCSHLFFIPFYSSFFRQGKQPVRSIHYHGKGQKWSQVMALKPLPVSGPSPSSSFFNNQSKSNS